MGLFVRGYRWNMGIGACTRIFQDPWLPRGFILPRFFFESFDEMRVWDIINCNGVQNVGLINGLFSLVMQSLFYVSLEVDEIIWDHDPKGWVYVKSVYNLVVSLKSTTITLRLDHMKAKPFQRSVWNVEVPSRVKLTMWKAISNALPTMDNICKKGIVANPHLFLLQVLCEINKLCLVEV